MSLTLTNPQQTIDSITNFIQQTYKNTKKDNAVIAVSGGIDSAISLSLLAKSLPADNIFPILLPYKDQSIEDSQTICKWNNIPDKNISIINITELSELFYKKLGIKNDDNLRKGNVMARIRMISIYDLAKTKNALVCGTENKSEKHLAYFTRFGDEASDLEPIQHLYKTQIRQIASFMKLPEIFTTKAPSAGLWSGQTDEAELGFSYLEADQIMYQYIDKNIKKEDIIISDISNETINKVISRITSQQFKHEVPYKL